MRGPQCITVPMCAFCMFHVCLLCVSVVAIDRCVYHLPVDVSVNPCLSVLCVVCVSHASARVCSCVDAYVCAVCVSFYRC